MLDNATITSRVLRFGRICTGGVHVHENTAANTVDLYTKENTTHQTGSGSSQVCCT